MPFPEQRRRTPDQPREAHEASPGSNTREDAEEESELWPSTANHPSISPLKREYQFIDPDSRELRGFATAQGLTLLHAQSPGEDSGSREQSEPAAPPAGRPGRTFAPVAGTPICRDIKQARQELLRIRRQTRELAATHGLKMMAAGAHPFSYWEREQEESPRYRALIEDTQFIARRLLAFGMNVHVGIDDRNLAIDVMNAMRYLLPHILCLAQRLTLLAGASDTGLASYRSVLLDALPPHRHPQRLPQPLRLSRLRRYPPAHQQHPRSRSHLVGYPDPTPNSRIARAPALKPDQTPSPKGRHPNRPRLKFGSATPCPTSTTCSPSPP